MTGVDGNADLMKDTLQVINNWIDANQKIERVDNSTIMYVIIQQHSANIHLFYYQEKFTQRSVKTDRFGRLDQ